MKIFIAEVPRFTQPASSPFLYPSYAEDYGIEQDLLNFLYLNSKELITTDIAQAEYVYIPIFWTRYHLINNFGQTGLEELQKVCEYFNSLPIKKFTICQYDDGPLVELKDTLVYLGSRKNLLDEDVPLLATKIPKPLPGYFKEVYDASFIGRLGTHPIRSASLLPISLKQNVLITEIEHNAKDFAKVLLKSKIGLAPRGYGGNSFRFYETIQLGKVPWLIGDIDTRPFKDQIPWNEISFYSKSAEDFLDQFDVNLKIVNKFKRNLDRSKVSKKLIIGKWPKFLIEDLKRKIQTQI